MFVLKCVAERESPEYAWYICLRVRVCSACVRGDARSPLFFLATARLRRAPRIWVTARHVLNFVQHFLSEFHGEGLQVLLKLLARRGADNGRRHKRSRGHKGKSELRRRHPVFCRKPAVLSNSSRRSRAFVPRPVALEQVEPRFRVRPLHFQDLKH